MNSLATSVSDQRAFLEPTLKKMTPGIQLSKEKNASDFHSCIQGTQQSPFQGGIYPRPIPAFSQSRS